MLAEFTGDNLNLALDGTLTKTAAGAAQVQKEEVESGGALQPDREGLGFRGPVRGQQREQFPVRLFIYKGVATINGDFSSPVRKSTGIPTRDQLSMRTRGRRPGSS